MSKTLTENSAEAFPLTSTQSGILAESLLSHERGMYVVQIVGELDEPLDIGHFRSAWQHAVAAFDALRLTMSWAMGAPPNRVSRRRQRFRSTLQT